MKEKVYMFILKNISERRKSNLEEIEEHFINENLRKMMLYSMKKSSKETQEEGRKFLNEKIRQRKKSIHIP